MTAFARSALFTLVFYGGSIPLVIAAALAMAFNQAAVIRHSRRWARFHYWCAHHILGIETRVEGALPQSGAIVAFKHESMYETIEVLRLLVRPAVVFKAELLAIPLWGRVARSHGVIPVAREAGSAALRQMLKAARAAATEQRPIVIFPEGTRVAHGARAPLRPGIAGLYKSLGLPIVPIALDSGRVWPRGRFIKHAGVVTLRVGEAIPPGLDRDEVERLVHEAINALNPPSLGRCQS